MFLIVVYFVSKLIAQSSSITLFITCMHTYIVTDIPQLTEQLTHDSYPPPFIYIFADALGGPKHG